MVMASRYRIVLGEPDRAELERRVRAGNTPQKDVLRALIVLLAADGAANAPIADELGICVDTTRKWRSGSARRASEHSRMRPVRGVRRGTRPPRRPE
ncbi:helix-turn-helix domain-containing protein [Rhodococcus pseudokoreensis]|jgi:hypothetical protein|uniref:helix-turn-helix domain-containing protein n=1 Tax=Rhodococcus pseudokoreensis TaxID=2811421 RepID=UPI0030841493